MWTRRELKARAKAILRNSYWRALIVSFIIVIAGGSLISNSGNSNSRKTNTNRDNRYTINSHVSNFQDRVRHSRWLSDVKADIPTELRDLSIPGISGRSLNSFFDRIMGIFSFPIHILAGILSLAIGLFVFAFRIMIGYNLEVGGRRYFLLAARGDERLSNTFSHINGCNYINITKTMFLRGLYTILWTFLFIIPGIVKSYAYRMVPYILADNPDMAPSEALALSCQMTDGHKMNMFILDISFFGWLFLGSLVFRIGQYFVNPYIESTYAQLYLTLSGSDGTYTVEDYIDTRPSNYN